MVPDGWSDPPTSALSKLSTGSDQAHFSAYRPKTHNLSVLGKRAADLAPDLRGAFPQDAPEDKRLFELLKSAYVDARYSPKFVITKDELEMLGLHVRKLRDRVARACHAWIGEALLPA
jgi:hypothetical protein